MKNNSPLTGRDRGIEQCREERGPGLGATILVLALCVAAWTDASAQALTLGPKTDFTTGTSPQAVAVGDLNADGKLDLAVANYHVATGNSISVLLGNGAGGFGPKTDYAAGNQPASIAIGDVNGDGKPDLMSSNWSASSLSVFLGDGLGGFGAKTDFATGSRPISGKLADLNGDNMLDAVVATWSTGLVQVLLGNGLGSFGAAITHPVLANAYSLALGDFNADGKLDVAVAYLNAANTSVSVLLGNGTGGFGAKTDFTAGAGPIGVALGDFNLDGKLDLAAVNATDNTVSVLLGNGLGGFAPKADFAVGVSPLALVVGDMNGDGRPDLVVSNNGVGSTTVSVLLGSALGGFAPKTDFIVGSQPSRLATDDLDGDGRLDLAVPNISSNTVSVLLNTTVDDPPTLDLTWGSFGSGNGQFRRPTAAAVDSADNVYVLDSGNSRIQKFDKNGAFLLAWGAAGSADGQFKWPYATYSAPRSNGPKAIAVNDRGSGNVDVYVADEGNHRVQKFDGNGAFLTKWGACGSANGEFGGPLGIVIDDAKAGLSAIRVYVTDGANGRIQQFDTDGVHLRSIASHGPGDGQLNVTGDPIPGVDVSLEQNPGSIWIGDTSNNRIQKFDKTGTFLSKWGSCGSADGEFDGPLNIVVDDAKPGLNASLFVTDGSSRIRKFDQAGVLLKSWGTQGSGDGQFGGPPSVIIATNTTITGYCSGTEGAGCIDIGCSASPGYVCRGAGTSPSDPCDECYSATVSQAGVSDTRLFAVDAGNYRMQKFNGSGTFLAKWGSRGTGPGQFGEAFTVTPGINHDPDACPTCPTLYVVDTNNHRMQKFKSASTVPLAVFPPADRLSTGLQLSAFPNPSTGQIQISFTGAAEGAARVEVYDVSGRAVWRKTLPAGGPTRLQWPGIDLSGSRVPSGMYFVRLRVMNEERRTSVILLK